MTKSWKVSLVAGALLAAFSSGVVAAEEGKWLVRARAVHLNWADESKAFGAVPSDAISVDNKTIPEVDISYFFTKNIAAELVLTYPQKFDVKLDGAGKIGSFKALPPSLLLQYHFIPEGTIRPYVGAGINYTLISDRKLLNGALKLDSDSVGAAVQVGVDFKLTDNLFLNVDVKKIWIDSDVRVVGGPKLTKVTLDPVAVGVGIGYRF